ncbi:hypothetical protein [uncultured Cellulomonas sp.]|uniref:hypothetical protein n=1 Tax=uncultured Cellulomonas sp. TaxID=189682 RepID=UPI0028F0D76D|nr:hypothetical protein [uncultured Cellulomonas sp.]
MKPPWVLVGVLAVLLVGYVVNDRIMAWDDDQKWQHCSELRAQEGADWIDCLGDPANDRWPVEF